MAAQSYLALLKKRRVGGDCGGRRRWEDSSAAADTRTSTRSEPVTSIPMEYRLLIHTYDIFPVYETVFLLLVYNDQNPKPTAFYIF